MKKLDKCVREEPYSALFGGKDGLDYYRIIAEEAGKHLREKGKLFLETGIGQSEAVRKLLEEKGFSVKIHKDYQGTDRIVEASLNGEKEDSSEKSDGGENSANAEERS